MRKADIEMTCNNCRLSRKGGRRDKQCGFTLVEIMIVILIIAALLNIALPSMLAARNTSQTNSCIGNLKTIQNAKQEWAIDTNQAGAVTPTWTDISPYFGENQIIEPVCPTSLQPYELGSVDEPATCPTYPVTHVMSDW
jgi:prepilin-type N-terminal cleavage/methylation domain-containing protein